MDTIVRKQNFGRIMMQKYKEKINRWYNRQIDGNVENINYIHLVPRNIIHSSAKYWWKELDICSKECIDELIKEYKLNPTNLHWEHLYELSENKSWMERHLINFDIYAVDDSDDYEDSSEEEAPLNT